MERAVGYEGGLEVLKGDELLPQSMSHLNTPK